MPGEYPEYHEPTPGNQEAQTPEDINIDQVKDPEAGLSMTMRGENDWQNNLNLDRKAAEDKMVLHLAEVIPVGDQPAETSEAAPLPTQPGVDNIAPVADTPEMTPEERAAKAEFIGDLSHDILYPNDPEYNQEQLENIKVMDSLLKNYPHAFNKGFTDDGKKYLLLKKAHLQDKVLKIMITLVTNMVMGDLYFPIRECLIFHEVSLAHIETKLLMEIMI